MTQSRTAAAIRASEAGEIVVVTDGEGRENKGGLIAAPHRALMHMGLAAKIA